jgi:hypothetical protein
MDDDEMSDDFQPQSDSISSEQQPPFWRTLLTTRMPLGTPDYFGWRWPLWVLLLSFVVGAIIVFGFGLHR